MSDLLRSIAVGTIALDVALLLALYLTLGRPARGDPVARDRLVLAAVLALAVQSVHFVEEAGTGFHVRFPELLGLRPWPPAFFVPFNLFWLVVWGGSIVALRSGVRAALFPIWFLAVGCALNGVAHPMLALAASGYFPGLWTSPLGGVAGVLLLLALATYTRKD